MSTYTIESVKGGQTINGNLADAMRAAITLEEELQPACGVTITDEAGQVFNCENGRVAIESTGGGEDDDEGHVFIDPDDNLMIAWDGSMQKTPFFDGGLIPA